MVGLVVHVLRKQRISEQIVNAAPELASETEVERPMLGVGGPETTS